MKERFKFLFISILFSLNTFGQLANNVDVEGHVAFQSPASFEENKGQVKGFDGGSRPEVKFVLSNGEKSVFLMEQGLAYQFKKTHYPEGYKNLSKTSNLDEIVLFEELNKKIRTETFRIDFAFLNSNKNIVINKEVKSHDFVNYYNHNALNVYSYEKITYLNIYDGIDWVVYPYEGGIKYDFIVHPNADPKQIKLKYSFQEDIKINDAGDLVLSSTLGDVIESSPISFQNNIEIKTGFVLKDDFLSFSIDSYDRSKVLVIDPISRVWGTYYGGTDNDFGFDCTTDATGNVYIAGRTQSSTLIANGGHDNSFGGSNGDAFLVKLNSAGLRQWATYYGGTDIEGAFGCAVDAAGNVFLSGYTKSTSGIAIGGYDNSYGGGLNYGDTFLVKFNSAGVRQWGTYYGGTSDDSSWDCAVDGSGNVYLVGFTKSTSAIASSGYQNTYGGGGVASGSGDAFLAKFNTSGARQWATYYGGPNEEIGYDCAIDGSNNVYITGYTTSSSGISSGGHQNAFGGASDGFLVKFNASGARQWATYYGGTSGELVTGVVADGSNNVFISGMTTSNTGIASGGHDISYGGGTGDGFLAKFNSTGARQWATYYGGGAGYASNSGVAVDGSNNVYLTGLTTATAGIALSGYDNTYSGSNDAYLVKFNASGTRQWATYYGGTSSESVNSCAVDGSNSVYIVGTTSSTSSIAGGGHQNSYGGGTFDGFVVKFVDCLTETNTTTNTAICENATKPLTSSGAGGGTWSIVSGGGTITGSFTYNPANVTAATTVVVRYVDGCGNGSNVSFTVNPLPGTPSAISGTTTPCNGVSTTYSISAASAATSYTWTYSGGGTPSGSGTSVTLSPTSSGTLSVTATNSCGNSSTTTLAITVVSIPAAPSTPTGTTPVCNGSSGNYAVTAISGATSYTWSYSGTGTPSGTGITTSMTPTTSGNLTVTATNACGTSSASSPLAITVTPIEDATFTYSANTYCISGTDPIPTITGVTGGSFAINLGGTVNSSTGVIDLDANGVNNYTVTYTTAGTCFGTETFDVNVTAGPQATFSYTGTPYCGGTGTAAVTYGAGGSAGAFAPVTPTTDLVINSTTGAVDLNASLPGTYTIENDIVASGGCAASYATSDITITAQEDATYSYGASTTFCENATNPTATITGTTGGAFTSTPTGLTVDGATGEIDLSTSTFGAGATSYTVRYITPGTCSDTLDILVTLDPSPTAPTVGTTAGSNTICEGESTDITASGSTGTGVTYAVFDAMTAGTNLGATPLTVSPTSTTTYYVESFNSNGCANVGGRQAVTVTVNPTPSIDAGADETICPTDNVILTVTGTGTVVWSTAETTSSITVAPLVTTTYGVTLTDANTCTNTDSVEVTVIVNGGTLVAEEDAFTTETDELINMDVLLNDIYGGNTTTIILIPNNGTATATINGSIDYQSDPDFIGTDSLVYEICDVTCAAICDTAVVIITVDKKIDFSVPGGFSPNGDNINDVFVIQGLEEYPNNSLSIFNRWGNIIYQAVPYSDDWDGSATEGTVLMGDKVTTGTYFYILELGEGIEPLRGSIEIKRD